jgi:hypothetical protein
MVMLTYRLVGDKMVNIVAALPPSDRKTTAKVGDKHANQGVRHKVGSNSQMASVVGSKHDLVLQQLASQTTQVEIATTYPEQAEKHGRRDIPLVIKRHGKQRKQGRVPEHLLAVLSVRTVVEPLIVDPLVKALILASDIPLNLRVDRRIRSRIPLNLAGDGSISHPQCSRVLNSLGRRLPGHPVVKPTVLVHSIITTAANRRRRAHAVVHTLICIRST